MKQTGSATRTSTGRQNRASHARGGSSGRGYNYIEGSAARKLQTAPTGRESERRRTQPRPVRRHKVKAVPMNKGYIAVMAAALFIVCGVLMSYIKLQSDITNHITNISKLESQLNEMKLANDETYTKIMSSVDLEEIKRIAVNELGMKYAKEGQVIEYTGEGNDYVRQYSDIPQ
ncbi:MAG: cell division protein FtsL [Lachnospiraceae bacterium]|nr:cell division protein FtsL [Lachnospiraceae bacterium]